MSILELLRSLEWASFGSCPSCWNMRTHAPDCALDAAIRGLAEQSPAIDARFVAGPATVADVAYPTNPAEHVPYAPNTSMRGIPLVYQGTPTITTLTVENYCKWYDLYLVRPDGTPSIVPFGALEPLCDEMERTPYVDHVPNPVIVERLCNAMGWELDEQSHEIMIGRWVMEGLDTSAAQVNAAIRGEAKNVVAASAEQSPGELTVAEMAAEMGLMRYSPFTYGTPGTPGVVSPEDIRTLYREYKAKQGRLVIDPASPMLDEPPTDPADLAAWLYARVVPGQTVVETVDPEFGDRSRTPIAQVRLSPDGTLCISVPGGGFVIDPLSAWYVNPDGSVLWGQK